MPFVSPESVNLIHGQWLEVRVLYNVSLITSINPTKEFIPSFFRLCRVAHGAIFGGIAEEKVGSIFSSHMHEIFVQVCEFHPLAATGAPLPSLSFPLSNHPVPLSRTHSRLTSKFQRAWYYRSCNMNNTMIKGKKKNKKRERERVEKSMEKAKIVLPMLYNGVKSNGVWRDYESDDGLDYRYVSTGKIWYFFVPCVWNGGWPGK